MSYINTLKILIIVNFDERSNTIESFNVAFKLRAALRSIGYKAYLFPNNLTKIIQEVKKENHTIFLIDNKIYHNEKLYENGLRYFLEKNGITKIGNSHRVVKITHNKILAKKWLKLHGIMTPQGLNYHTKIDDNISSIKQSVKCILKLKRGGGSGGMKYFENIVEASDYLNEIGETFRNKYFVEEYIEGQEYTCWSYNVEDTIKFIPIKVLKYNTKIADRCSKLNLYNKDQGYLDFEVCDIENLEDTEVRSVIEYTNRIHIALKAEHIIRTDMIIRKGIVYILEINSMPRIFPSCFGDDTESGKLKDFLEIIKESTKGCVNNFIWPLNE